MHSIYSFNTGTVTVGKEENLRPRSADSLPPESEQSSFTEIDEDVEGSTRGSLPKSKSWSNSPRLSHGIPLGSLMAQEAAKSFWTTDMLQERIQKITEYAALETSSLGSSIDDSLSMTMEDLEEVDIPTSNTTATDLVVRSTPATPRQHSPAVLRSQSALLTGSKSCGRHVTRTQPFLSPRITARLSTRRAVQSASSSPSMLTNTSLVIEGKQKQLSPRNFSPVQDDGFHEQ